MLGRGRGVVLRSCRCILRNPSYNLEPRLDVAHAGDGVSGDAPIRIDDDRVREAPDVEGALETAVAIDYDVERGREVSGEVETVSILYDRDEAGVATPLGEGVENRRVINACAACWRKEDDDTESHAVDSLRKVHRFAVAVVANLVRGRRTPCFCTGAEADFDEGEGSSERAGGRSREAELPTRQPPQRRRSDCGAWRGRRRGRCYRRPRDTSPRGPARC